MIQPNATLIMGPSPNQTQQAEACTNLDAPPALPLPLPIFSLLGASSAAAHGERKPILNHRAAAPRARRGGAMALLAPPQSSHCPSRTHRARRFPAAGAPPEGRPAPCSSRSPLQTYHRGRRQEEIVPFAESWAWQQSILTRRKGLVDRDEDRSDTLIALQHSPVYTLGTGSSEDYLHFNVGEAPFEIHRIKRGGEVTYHGPGQLVMYPILNLRYHKTDLHWYLWSLEEVIIRALKSAFSIEASRVEGLTGVWVGDQKVAAVGIHVSQWIAYNGLALNVTTDLTPFEIIDPCGIKDRGVGSIKEILQNTSDGRDIDDTLLIDRAYNSLIKEFSELFKARNQNKQITGTITQTVFIRSASSFNPMVAKLVICWHRIQAFASPANQPQESVQQIDQLRYWTAEKLTKAFDLSRSMWILLPLCRRPAMVCRCKMLFLEWVSSVVSSLFVDFSIYSIMYISCSCKDQCISQCFHVAQCNL
ncbi:uncharacterized protein LOC133906635 [Phragmites australis]|uniref:uncharacterized protein LOC133906635 n=1 Tax=Phragmites australis TaxID=29695 RepID=UPI002D779606|nr:uncharacterized protein LOC133906635 [Phragmites australis]